MDTTTQEGHRIKIVVIAGPTASGKSALAVKLARWIASANRTGGPHHYAGAEIISADSRQVYRGMDIGTGKITKREMVGVPHHLLDVASPKKQFSVSRFVVMAKRAIKQIQKRGNIPIIVGGTGLWIDALVYDWPLPEVKPNAKLRLRFDKLTAKHLFEMLEKLDPVRAKNIDRHNKRRLIRALEIIKTTKQPVQDFQIKYQKDPTILYLGIDLPFSKLEKKIKKRLLARIKQGLVAEVRNLKKSGLSWQRLESFGLEYRFVALYLQNKLTHKQMIEETYRAIRRYAKRQLRWFKRNGNVVWISTYIQAQKLARDFLDQ